MRTLIFYFLCLPVFISAQPITFSKIFSNYPLNSENGWEIAEFKEGYILVSTSRNPDNDNEVWCNMTRLDQNGDIIWYQQLPFYPNRGGALLIHDNLIYICGSTNEKYAQFFLCCIDLTGNVLWTQEYGKSNVIEGGPLLALTRNQEFILFGARYRDSVNKRDPLLYFVKTNMQGDSLDEFTYGGKYRWSISRGLVYTHDGQVVFSYPFCHIACAVDNSGGVSSMDTDGNILWSHEFADSYLPGTCLVIQPDSATIVAKWYVRREDPNADKNPPALYFIGLDGQIRDTFVFDNVTLADISGISATPDGGVTGCGRRFGINTSPRVLFPWIFRMNAKREVLWEREYADTTYGGSFPNIYQVIPTRDGGFITAGLISNNMTGVPETHNWILKLDADGCLSPGCGPRTIITANEEPVFLKGVGIEVYPNPGDEWLHVRFPPAFEREKERVLVSLVSNTGSLVQSLPATAGVVTFSLAAVPAGLYFVVIRRGREVVLSKRVVVAR